MTRQPPYRCLILDLDGTVVDSHAYTFDAFRHACAPYRSALSDAEIYAAFGPWERVILGGLLRSEEIEPAYTRLQEYYAAHAATLAVHPRLRPLLHDCREAEVRCGLFTGRGSDSTAMILATLDLAWAFGAIVAGNDVLRPKPAGDGVLQLLSVLDRGPAETLVVGDSGLDLQAAHAAGAAAAFANWYPWSGRGVPEASLVLESPDGLRPLLGLRDAKAGATDGSVTEPGA